MTWQAILHFKTTHSELDAEVLTSTYLPAPGRHSMPWRMAPQLPLL